MSESEIKKFEKGSFHNLLVPRGLVDEAGAVVVVVAEVDQVFANDIERLIQMNLK